MQPIPIAKQPLAAVPTLDDLASDHALATGLSPSACALLLGRVHSAAAALEAQLLAAAQSQAPARELIPADRPLDADQIAAALGTDRRWVFRNCKKLPFVRRTSRKALVASEAALRRWRESQKA